MAMLLAKNGKDKLALKALSQTEEYYLKIPRLLEMSKEQGVTASSDLTQRLKLSNAKHREVEEIMLKDLPQGQKEYVNRILDLNLTNKKKIEKL